MLERKALRPREGTQVAQDNQLLTRKQALGKARSDHDGFSPSAPRLPHVLWVWPSPPHLQDRTSHTAWPISPVHPQTLIGSRISM